MLLSTPLFYGYHEKMTLDNVTIMGLDNEPKTVEVNGKSVAFFYSNVTQALNVYNIGQDMKLPIEMTWH